MPNTNNKLIGTVKGAVNSAIKDALNNIISSTYITNVTWDSGTNTLSFWSGNTLKYSCVIELGLRDDPTKPLYFLSKQNGSTVKLTKNGTHNSNDVYQTSTDGTTWSNYTSGTSKTLNNGEGIYFRISASRQTTFTGSREIEFRITGNVEAYHNVHSLLRPNFSTLNNLTYVAGSGAYCLCYLFAGCSGLTKAPLLPATIISDYCYENMFYNCTGLTQAPSLPATTLKKYCYYSMFKGCTSLAKSGDLPATTLTDSCYSSMFSGCTSLSEVHIFATDISASSCLAAWLNNVSATGDFYCVNGVNYPSGASGKPTNWTRHDIT